MSGLLKICLNAISLTLLLLLASCSQNPVRTTDNSSVLDFDEKSIRSVVDEKFIKTLTENLNNGTLTEDDFHIEYLISEVRKFDGTQNISDSKMLKSLVNAFNNKVSTANNDKLKWLFVTFRGNNSNKEPLDLVYRLDGIEAIQYISIKLLNTRDGVKIADWYNHNSQLTLSYAVGKYVSLGYLATKKQKSNPDDTTLRAFSNFSKTLLKGNYQALNKWFNRLPESYKNERLIQIRRLEAARQESQDVYHSALEEYYARFGTRMTDGHLIDYYLYIGENTKAAKLFEKQSQEIGGDAELDVFIASVYFLGEDYKSCLKYTKSLMRKTPKDERAYWLSLKCFANLNQHQEMLLVLDILKHTFQFTIETQFFDQEEYYLGFKNSKQFDIWYNKNQG